jgi:putative drug exporter of the RND superfamily
MLAEVNFDPAPGGSAMSALTRFVLKHKLLVVAIWVALAVAGGMAAAATTKRLTSSFAMPGAAFRTDARIQALYLHDGAQDPIVPVITLPAGTTIQTPGVVARLDRAFATARHVIPTARVADYATTHDTAFATHDGRTTYALVFGPQQDPMSPGAATARIQQAIAAAVPGSWQVRMTGIQALANSKPSSNGAGVLVEAMLGGLGALVVLAFVFASFLAFVPLVMAGISIMTTFLALNGLTHLTAVSVIVEFLIALIGLGVAIDYSLLVVTRWREERAHGLPNEQAVVAAMASAGRAVLFSGLTVGIGLLALVALPVPFLRSAGIGGVLIPLISVAVALTMLPVILASIGPRLDWPRIRTDNTAGRGWSAWARFIVRHRGFAALAGTATLIALMLPALSMHVGEPSTAALAQSGPAHAALSDLKAGGVPTGTLTPIDVLARQAAIPTVTQRVAELPGVHAVISPTAPQFRRHDTALITVLPTAETNVPAGQTTLSAVRRALAHTQGVIGVAGSGASMSDFSHDVYGSFPLMLGLIALATFVLLARAFRSLLLPLKAVVMNLASLAAAYGVMTWIWQFGHGSQALWSIPATGAITMWVPVMVFAFLFGLSMDYEVFILARMRESYDRTGDTRAAVIEGIGRTGRLVTSAALILVLSFLAMSTGPETDLKILATGLGAGILVDATLIRCLLVPAFVSLFGAYNWWLPGWAARLLRVKPSPLHTPSRPRTTTGGAIETEAARV